MQPTLRAAELGQFDSTLQQWVSAQPYTIGEAAAQL